MYSSRYSSLRILRLLGIAALGSHICDSNIYKIYIHEGACIAAGIQQVCC